MRGAVRKRGKRNYIVYTVIKKRKGDRASRPNTKKNAGSLLMERVNKINRDEYRGMRKATFAELVEGWFSGQIPPAKPEVSDLVYRFVEQLPAQIARLGHFSSVLMECYRHPGRFWPSAGLHPYRQDENQKGQLIGNISPDRLGDFQPTL